MYVIKMIIISLLPRLLFPNKQKTHTHTHTRTYRHREKNDTLHKEAMLGKKEDEDRV